MKYVQIGILASLVVIAGLLLGIYNGRQPAEAPAAVEAEATAVAPSMLTPEQTAKAEGPAEVAEAKPSPLPPKKRQPAAKPKAAPPPPASPIAEDGDADYLPPPVSEPVIPNLPPLAAPEPAPLPKQQLVTVPEGTEIVVRLVNTLSTNRNLPGDTFEATLDKPLAIDGWLVAPKGSKVEGRILESKKAGRVKGVAALSFDLIHLTTAEGKTVDIATAAFGQEGDQSRGDDLKKVGVGAGIGAIIGAIAGGGKGAAIGAGVGGGAGAGTVLATRGETVVVPTETQLTFRLQQPLQVTSTKTVTL